MLALRKFFFFNLYCSLKIIINISLAVFDANRRSTRIVKINEC